MDAHPSTRAGDLLPSDELSERRQALSIPDAVIQSVTRELMHRYVHGSRGSHGQTAPVLESPPDAVVDRFCDMLIDVDASKSRQFFDGMRRDGATTDTLSLRYVAPAARRLGERWVSDECSFLEVTLGASRLHGLQRSLRSDFKPANLNQMPELTALFTSTPGDTHVLGVTMAADFFRRAGWNVDLNTSPEIEVLLAQASLAEYALVGLSVGAYPEDGRLEETAHRLREFQPSAKLVLGGRVDGLGEDLVAKIAPDAIVEDVTTAPFSLQTMLFSVLNG